MRASTDQILAEVPKLPMLPSSALQLSNLLNSEDSRARDIEEIIEYDPSITANTLKVANSFFYSKGRSITSIRQAIVVLGLQQIVDIAIGSSLWAVLPKTMIGYGISTTEFQVHSISVAMIAKKLAEELKLRDVGLVFSAGLLHDIGKIPISSYLSKKVFSDPNFLVVGEKEVSLITLENEKLGTDHTKVGKNLLKKWNLPEPIPLSAELHHSVVIDPSPQYRSATLIVYTSNMLSQMLGYGKSKHSQLVTEMNLDLITSLGVKTSMLETIGRDAKDLIDEMCSILI